MTMLPDPAPRRPCPRCGGPVIRYEDESLCLDCVRWTLTGGGGCAGCGDGGLDIWSPLEEPGDGR